MTTRENELKMALHNIAHLMAVSNIKFVVPKKPDEKVKVLDEVTGITYEFTELQK